MIKKRKLSIYIKNKKKLGKKSDFFSFFLAIANQSIFSHLGWCSSAFWFQQALSQFLELFV